MTYLVNSSQGLAASYVYDAYGNTVSQSGSVARANVYRFSSKEWVYDGAGGYYAYGYRFYHPNLQRWLNRDPMEENGGLNLYGFVYNNPIGLIDTDGKTAHGWPVVPPPGYPPTFPTLPPALPKPPQYPPGFSLCQRDILKDGSCDCPTMFANSTGGQHTYVQHVDDNGNKWGYGFGQVGVVEEAAFKPNRCKPCKITGGLLKHGSGKGKPANAASVADIKDCVKNHPPSKDYKAWGRNRYNCKDWAEEAAENCGLVCK